MPTFTVANPAQDHATVQPSPSRRFGVELEMLAPASFTGNAQDHASTVLTGLGIRNEIAGPFGRNYTVWQCKRDGSIQPYGRGVEVVSRILPAGEAGIAELYRVATAIEAAGFKVNRSCGLHCHINVSDLPFHVRQLIVLRYAGWQSDIDAMLPPSRRTGANGFCQTMTAAARVDLARFIDGGMQRWPVMATQGGSSYDHYSATNVQWASQSGDGCRIEFRQAAASVDANKIVAWVRFLQEMIDEVVRRAAGLTFGGVPAAPVRPGPQRFGGTVPNLRYGSDNERAMRQLCTAGVLTPAWSRDAGIADNVLRRIIVGFRRHGAGIVTVRGRNGEGASYALSGVTSLPVSRAAVFAPTVIQPAPEPVPAPVAPAVTRAAEFVAYPFNAGLSAVTIAWCDRRRATLAARP